MKRVLSWLNKPYPGPENFKSELKGMAIAALIVFLILFLFKPFGLTYYKGDALWICLGFGAVTFVVGVAFHAITLLVLRIHKDISTWKIKHWIIDSMLLILCIGIANYAYLITLTQQSFHLGNLSVMLLYTLFVGSIPLIIFGYQTQLRQERKYAATAAEMKPTNTANQKEPSSSKIIAAQAMQNYVHSFMLVDGSIEKETLRSTLTSFHKEQPHLLKCHRSYLVDLSAVQSISGNAQGLKLKLHPEDAPEVLVSRGYVAEIRGLMENTVLS